MAKKKKKSRKAKRKKPAGKKSGGFKGKFYSEQQRRYMWANHPKAAKKWAHWQKTNKGDW